MNAPLDKTALAAFRKLAPDEQQRQLRGQKVARAFAIERDAGAIDEQARTVWLSVASEAPYERWWGTEILDMNSKSIRDERLRMGAPLLVGHDADQQVGVVERFEITAEKKLRILARFGRSDRAEEIFRDVLDGIRRNASVGYVIHDLRLERQDGDVCTYRVTDWEPLEGSLVPIPADPSVGVGRALDATPKPSTTPQKDTMDPKDISADVRAQIEAETRAKIEKETAERAAALANTPEAIAKREQERVSAILKAGTEFRDLELATEIAQDAKATVETFKARLLEKQRSAQKPLGLGGDPKAAAGTGLRVHYNHSRLQAFKDLPIQGGGTMKAEEAAYRSGMFLAASVYRKPWAQRFCRENGIGFEVRAAGDDQVFFADQTRAQNENVLSAGAAVVPVEMEAAVIRLIDQYGVARRLARVRPMNTDTLKIPRRKSGVTAYFFQDDDGVGITESSKGWDNVTLSTKKLGAQVRYSRDLAEDAVISLGDDIAFEIGYAFAIKEDQCFLTGDGTSTYGGIQGIITKLEASAYISRYTMTSHGTFATVDNSDVTNVMASLAQYADTPEAVFLTSHYGKHALFNRLKAVAGGNRVDSLGNSPDNSYLGYQIMTSEAMPKSSGSLSNKVMFMFGRFDLSSSFGARRGIEILTSVDRLIELGQIMIVGTERFDVVTHDVGTTSTSDVNGGRGPVAAGYGG